MKHKNTRWNVINKKSNKLYSNCNFYDTIQHKYTKEKDNNRY